MCKKIPLPRSKSIVIRCLIVHYLRTGTLLPVFDNDPNDIKIVHNTLKIIDLQKQTSVREECVIDVEDCGAAYRFLMPLLAATQGNWILTGTPRLLQRPILSLVYFLNAHGANIEKTDLGWRITGTELNVNQIDIDTTETSQFASALLMQNKVFYRKVCKEGASDIQAGCKSLHSNPYIRMTEIILQTHNLDTSHLLTLSDWSAATFWLANALLIPNTHYLLERLHFDNLQGDAAVASYFKKWGLTLTETEIGIDVMRTKIMVIPSQHINVTQMSDIALILAVLSVCYPFELTLSGLKNLNLKESSRLDILVNELSKFTTVEQSDHDIVIIHKRINELPKSFHFDSYNDHRFVMAWSLFKNFGTVDIINHDFIKKSYPDFKL